MFLPKVFVALLLVAVCQGAIIPRSQREAPALDKGDVELEKLIQSLISVLEKRSATTSAPPIATTTPQAPTTTPQQAKTTTPANVALRAFDLPESKVPKSPWRNAKRSTFNMKPSGISFSRNGAISVDDSGTISFPANMNFNLCSGSQC